MRTAHKLTTVLKTGAAADSNIIFDTFTDANGTSLDAHTPDTDTVGTGWAVVTSTYTVESNKADASGSGSTAIIDAGTGEVDITATINGISNDRLGIHYRCNDGLGVEDAWVYDTSKTQSRFVETIGSGGNVRATLVVSLSDSTDYTMRIVATGGSHTGTIDGVNEITTTNTNQQAQTWVGIKGRGTDTHDDYTVVAS